MEPDLFESPRVAACSALRGHLTQVVLRGHLTQVVPVVVLLWEFAQMTLPAHSSLNRHLTENLCTAFLFLFNITSCLESQNIAVFLMELLYCNSA